MRADCDVSPGLLRPILAPARPADSLSALAGAGHPQLDHVLHGRRPRELPRGVRERNSASVCNKFGQLGSQFTNDSIWNASGRFDSKNSSDSPWNVFSTSGPVIVDESGKFHIATGRFPPIWCSRKWRPQSCPQAGAVSFGSVKEQGQLQLSWAGRRAPLFGSGTGLEIAVSKMAT